MANRVVSPSSSDAESGKFHKDLVSDVRLKCHYECVGLIITMRCIVCTCGIYIWLVAWYSGRMFVFDRRTLPVLCSTCS